ncbi:peptidyl-prolyl cis-trans isomerase CWC27 homolog [Lingula anatina]|uniref:Spliceosome-associated protein CWC27 homolog n=1 Tax=Lingula anatina TaxID=7574 RepID=A0A1S3ILA7_LINAN|nr:peptidyl-prolyl cis-trans isomerase CWC27 homolog [Lingula anatina]|eukprot:XP_013398671.1 peptidyl-prolyl cis-trans isomerase CWC27 homolog [Lingula anatina]
MSNIYIQEPPTNGKVLLVTTVGDIDIELWSRECPKTCRNFIQLCMEGYYDGTIFHRVVPGFIVQGGDPTGTGEGGESVYGKPFKDEFHQRLQFKRRGLVAMANAGKNDNGSQFFFTLEATPELHNKHTIFGKVAGNTIYNMLKLAETETDQNERPLYPHKILKTEILSNPYDDILPRSLPKRAKKEEEKDVQKKKSKSKATKNFKLLSFGEEAEEDEQEVEMASKEIKSKSKSMHDFDDPTLSAVTVIDKEEDSSSGKRKSISDDESNSNTETDKEHGSKDKIMKKLKKETKVEIEHQEEPEVEKKTSRSEELRKEVRELKKQLLEAKQRKEKESHPNNKDENTDKKAEDPALVEFKQERQKYKERKKTQPKKGAGREEQTLALLAKFQNKLHEAISMDKTKSKSSIEGEEEEDDDNDDSDISWLGHKLEFEDKSGKVLDANVDDSERYEIFDPRNPMNKRRREASKQNMKGK